MSLWNKLKALWWSMTRPGVTQDQVDKARCQVCHVGKVETSIFIGGINWSVCHKCASAYITKQKEGSPRAL